jgi:hypothetical protein
VLTRTCSVSASPKYHRLKSEPLPSHSPISKSQPKFSYRKKKIKPKSPCSRRSTVEQPGPSSSQISDDRTTTVTFPEDKDFSDPRFLRSDAAPSRRMTDNDLYFVVTRGVTPGVYKGCNAAETALGSFGHRVYYKCGMYHDATERFVQYSRVHGRRGSVAIPSGWPLSSKVITCPELYQYVDKAGTLNRNKMIFVHFLNERDMNAKLKGLPQCQIQKLVNSMITSRSESSIYVLRFAMRRIKNK